MFQWCIHQWMSHKTHIILKIKRSKKHIKTTDREGDLTEKKRQKEKTTGSDVDESEPVKIVDDDGE